MRGLVLTLLNQMVEERLGFEVWERALEVVRPSSGGVYTAGERYDDAELGALVAALADITALPADTLVTDLGRYTLAAFARMHPEHFRDRSARELLLSVDRVIHIEVRKLHPDASLPAFEYETSDPDRLVMLYRSPRRMCAFAVGLVEGVARHYATPIHHRETRCLHRGDDHCRFELAFGEPGLAA
ncbi:MAG: heme NO-binding domain-containing protein [Ectothiorhodospiraceae bacterium]|nr:heme NO-binding domain-containing protein [Chromatiales bacterium]MCP5155448.1 heme NO-binding domain-containing protein [Ectothiorhodospiraceae bacterium]